MIDEFAKEHLHDHLRWVRESLVWKLDGLAEYDIRRPLTSTGPTSSAWSSTWRSGGQVLRRGLRRPFPEPLPRWDDTAADGTDLWATEHETRDEIIDFYRRVWEHSDATINALDIDAPGYVPWWPRPREAVQHPGPHALRYHPARGTRRHPARTARRPVGSRSLGARPRTDTTRPSGRHGARRSSAPPGQLIQSHHRNDAQIGPRYPKNTMCDEDCSSPCSSAPSGRVGDWRGSAAARPVSSPRPSNRACGSPAHGLPTFFTGGVRPARASPGRAWAG